MQSREMRFRLSVLTSLLLVVTISLTTGCEPLRKKFVRQKKKTDIQEEAIPLFSPQEYPENKKSSTDVYRHYYSLWQLWQTDLLTALEDGRSDKKVRYDLNQLLLQVEGMQKIVVAEKRGPLQEAIQKLQGIQRDMDTPAPLRNISEMKRTIESVGKTIRKDYSPVKIGDNLIK